MKNFRAAFDDLWYLSRPYFTSEEKKSAWVLLTAVLRLTLLLVGVGVLQKQIYQSGVFVAFKHLSMLS